MQLLMRRPETDGFISVTPPTNMYDFSFLAPCPASGLILHGGQDTIVPPVEVERVVAKLRTQKGIVIDHEVAPRPTTSGSTSSRRSSGASGPISTSGWRPRRTRREAGAARRLKQATTKIEASSRKRPPGPASPARGQAPPLSGTIKKKRFLPDGPGSEPVLGRASGPTRGACSVSLRPG